MAAANSPELLARHDAKDFHKPGADQAKQVEHIAASAHSMSVQGLKSEQKYWDSLSKASHDHLPGLSIHHSKDGSVDTVKQGNKEIFNHESSAKAAGDKLSAGLQKGHGPYSAFREQGMNDQEAKVAAHRVSELTGRHNFKQGEQFKVGQDGSVTTQSEHKGVTTEEHFNSDKSTSTKVLQKDGSFIQTDKDKDGHISGSIERQIKPDGSYLDTRKDKDGKVSESMEHEVKPDGSRDTKRDASGKTLGISEVRPDSNTKTTFENNKPKEINAQFKDGHSVDVKLNSDGTVAQTITTQSDKTSERVTNLPGGITETQKSDGTGNYIRERKDSRNNVVETTDHRQGVNGAYTEHTVQPPTSGHPLDRVLSRGESQADGSFKYKQVDRVQPGESTEYNGTFDSSGRNGTGTRTRHVGGKAQSSASVAYTVNNGEYNFAKQ